MFDVILLLNLVVVENEDNVVFVAETLSTIPIGLSNSYYTNRARGRMDNGIYNWCIIIIVLCIYSSDTILSILTFIHQIPCQNLPRKFHGCMHRSLIWSLIWPRFGLGTTFKERYIRKKPLCVTECRHSPFILPANIRRSAQLDCRIPHVGIMTIIVRWMTTVVMILWWFM